MYLKSLKDALGNGTTLIVLKIITFFTGVVIARYLGASERGVYAFIIVISSLGIHLSFLGIDNSIQYYISKKKYSPKESSFVNIILGLCHGVFVSVAIFVLWYYGGFSKMNSQLDFFILLPIFLQLPLDGVFFLLKAQLIGLSEFKKSNILQTLQALSFAMITLALLFGTSAGLLGCLWSLFVSKLIVVIYQVVLIRDSITLPKSLNLNYFKDLYTYGSKASIGNLSAKANNRFDQLILGFVATSSQLGIYAVAYSIISLLIIPSNTVMPILFNYITKTESKITRLNITSLVHKILFWVQLSLGLTLFLFGYWIIELIFGNAYVGAYQVILFLIPGVVLYNSTCRVIQRYLAAIGKPLQTSTILLIGAIISIASYLILIPIYGIYGAALGSSIGYLGASIFALYLFQKENDKNNILILFFIYKSDIVFFKNIYKDLQYKILK